MKSESNSTHSTLLVMITGFLVLYFIFKTEFLLWIAAGVGVVSLIIPKAGIAIEWVWNKIARGLGWINTRILLGVVFFLILCPLAWLARIFGKINMQLRRTDQSTFTVREHTYVKEDFENPW